MIQVPVPQLETLRYDGVTCSQELKVGINKVDFFTPSENSYELDLNFDVENQMCSD